MLAALIRNRLFFFTLLTIPAWFVLLSIIIPNLNAWEFRDIQNFLGNTAMFLLIFVLSLTPLTQLFSKSRLAQAFNTHRRSIGISCYLYALAHFSCFLISMPETASIIQDLQEFTYLKLGLAALILLTPLFLTSNRFSVGKFGYKPWKLLHRLAYVAAIAIFLHRSFGEEVQLFQTILIFLPLLVLETLRVLQSFFRLFQKKKPAPIATSQPAKPKPAWQGYREFKVVRKNPERGDICSFFLKPVDSESLPPFAPGQYLTFKFDVPGQAKPILRCYSISDAPSEDHYRISVKLQPPPKNVPTAAPGISSTHLHRTVEEGDILQVKAPAGKFTLEDDVQRIVLVSSGVGATPMVSMLNHRINQGLQENAEIWYFHGARSRAGHFMAEYLESLSDKHPQLRVRVCYSREAPPDKAKNEDYQLGRVGAAYIREQLPNKN
jgi:ferredoxin-NADP reductase/DMSO/TMAO reductase YedYZ heme-binding membrane subunit